MPLEYQIHIIFPVFVLLLAGAFGWGIFLLRITGLFRILNDAGLFIVHAFLIGLIFLSDLVLFFGMAWMVHPWITAVVTGCGIVCGGVTLTISKEFIPAIFLKKLLSRRKILFLLLCAPFVVIIFLYTLVPDVSGDAYLYHITVPNYYHLEGRIEPVPLSFCYNYPLQMQMIYLAGVTLNAEQAGVMVNFILLLITAYMLYRAGKELRSEFAGMTATFVFLTTPLVFHWGRTSLVDLPTAAFMSTAFVNFLLWRKNRHNLQIFLCGICAGGVMAVKLMMGAFTLAFLPAGIFIASVLSAERKMLRNLAIYGIGAVVVMLPWMIKNAIFAYNPVFPFFLDVFPTRPDLLASAQTLHKMHGIPSIESAGGMFKRILGLFPLLRFEACLIVILAILLIPVQFFRSIRLRKNISVWAILILMETFLLYYGRRAQVRWFLSFYAMFCIPVAVIVTDVKNRYPKIKKWIVIGGICFLAAFWGKMYHLWMLEHGINPFIVFSEQKLEKFINHQSRTEVASVYNRNLPEDAKILIVHMEIMSPGRWMQRKFIQAGERWLMHWKETNSDPGQIKKDLASMDVTHVGAPKSFWIGYLTEFRKKHLEKSPSDPPYIIYKIKY